jgi:phosphatidylserine/phosphatidylglycerophosphate/cardiolipin synthase-like enzyme
MLLDDQLVMKLIVQPDAGVAPVITAIKQAKKSIDVLIFRFDRIEIGRALEAAVARGVHVRALTAHANRGGTKSLRKLEMHLLEAGVTVSRTADDLIRYHGKMMVVDEKVLHVFGYNFTAIDMEKSRSFAIVTKNAKLVNEAMKLFSADFDRQPFVPSQERLVVSPENSRERLSAFIKGARKELLIYDPRVSDDAILRRTKAGVDVRIIGKIDPKWELASEKYPGKRLHVRAIVRDGRRAFVGSQSLRRIELDKRREIGVLVHDLSVVSQLRATFESDWAETDSGKKEAKRAEKAARKEEKLAAAS